MRQAEQERWPVSIGAMGCFRDLTQSSQLAWCSLLSYRCISLGPITDVMILGSLAARALLSLSFATGSLEVTCSSPRETKIQPSVPSNLRPLGKSSLMIIFTPFAYRASVRNLP